MTKRSEGPKPVGDTLTKALERLENTIRENNRKLVEANAQPGEIPDQVRARLLVEERQKARVAAKKAKPPKGLQREIFSGPLTKKDKGLLKLRAELDEKPGTIEDASYFHIAMCQVALPRSLKAVKGLDVFERTSGTSSIRVEAGAIWNGQEWVKQPIPYGGNPRLILAYLNTFAVRERTKVIPLGDSWRDLLAMLGKSSTGGRNGSLTRFKADIQALAACKMLLGYVRNGNAITYDGKPVKEFQAWIGKHVEGQRGLWPATLTFSDDYYNALTDGRMAVPVDMRAMIELSGSALAMDIYLMLAERLHRMSGRGLPLYWHQLRQQFGQEYSGKYAEKTFKNNFIAAFRQVQIAYPQCKAKLVEGGLLLLPSPPPIAPKV
ncbi:replication protein [Escherichia coli]|uniref:replication protein RepA n=1 Tax=Klebsiella pneumoniae TaxID=573 RepID=UPI001983161B|nr:replication protein [Salmonella enterica subsp. enterica serovar Agona]EEO8595867.1 replication protein [Salmonella enterica]EGC7299282.1 replication protein [Escherichia coli]EEP4903116.1 replication protein [Salmonella enterica]EFN6389205.1 replication protein [Salmonella enterica]